MIVDKFLVTIQKQGYSQSIHTLYTGLSGRKMGSALDDLVKDMQFVVQLGVSLAIFGNFAN